MAAFPFDIAATDGARPHRRAEDPARRHPHARLHAGRHRRHGEGPDRRPGGGQTGADIILGNTYHLMLRPGAERVERLGGLHRFMRWDKPILTDCGGFQVMSLSKISKVKEEAVTFQSHIDGSRHVLSPERSIEIQADLLGADIVMQLDECVAWPAEEARAARGHGAVGPLGRSARKAAFGDARRPRPCSASSRARPSRTCAASRAERLHRDRLRRLRHRRPGGRRGPRGHVRGARLRARHAARRPAALSDGRRQADRPGRGGVRAASTCSTASCPPARAATARPGPGTGRST